MSLENKTAFITGASRGIGNAIAKKLASNGCNIIVAAKTTEPHPKLEGTIYTAAEELESMGVAAMPVYVDIRDEDVVKNAVEQAVEKMGGIDIVINNASAISLTPIEQTSMKRYDLMHDINVRGTFMVSKYCIPHLKNSDNPHILTLAPPLNLDPKWFGNHLAYTMSKYGMSMTVIGQAEQLKDEGIAANALWPKTTIATAAILNIVGGEALMKMSRRPEIMADAAYHILTSKSSECSGNFFIDEDVLRENGVSDFDQYAIDLEQGLMPDLFL